MLTLFDICPLSYLMYLTLMKRCFIHWCFGYLIFECSFPHDNPFILGVF